MDKTHNGSGEGVECVLRKSGGVGRVGCFGDEFASDKGTSLGGSGECRLDGVHLVRCGLDPVVESGA